MSTRSTLKATVDWTLQEEMISETVELVIPVSSASFRVTEKELLVVLPPDVLHHIACLYIADEFPHQRRRRESS